MTPALVVSALLGADVTIEVVLRYADEFEAAQAHGRMIDCTASSGIEFEAATSAPTLDGLNRIFSFTIDFPSGLGIKNMFVDVAGKGLVKMAGVSITGTPPDVVIRYSDGLVWQEGIGISGTPGYITDNPTPGVAPWNCDPSSAAYQPCMCDSEANPGMPACCDPASMHYHPEVCDDDGDGTPNLCDPDHGLYDPAVCDCDNDGRCDNTDCSSVGYHADEEGGDFPCHDIRWWGGAPRVRNPVPSISPSWEFRPPDGGGRVAAPVVCEERECEEGEEGEGGGPGYGGGKDPGGGGGYTGGGPGGGGGGGGGNPGGGPGNGFDPPFWEGPDPPELDDCCELILYSLGKILNEQLWWHYEGSVLLNNKIGDVENQVYISNVHLQRLVGGYSDGVWMPGLWEKTFGIDNTYAMHIEQLVQHISEINIGLENGPGGSYSINSHSTPGSSVAPRNMVEVLDPSEGAAPSFGASDQLLLPYGPEGESGAPVWEWSIQFPAMVGVTFPPIEVSIDWEFYEPYKWAVWMLILVAVSFWAALTIWEELRRY